MEIAWVRRKGLYPIVSKKGTWFLDRSRRNPRLRTTRTQFPLAPAFAMTCHAAQGQTLKGGAIVDLCIGSGTNPLGSYAAMTRVTRRESLLIYRPFSRELFTQGEREGPSLLLRHLRGEELDWRAIEAKYTPQKRCNECNFVHFKEHFQTMQWNRKDNLSVCKECVAEKKKKGTPLRCNNCGLWKAEASFSDGQQHGMRLLRRVCTDCMERRQCSKCHERKFEKDFTPGEWKNALYTQRDGKCMQCMARNCESKACAGGCGRTLASNFYTKRMWRENPAERKCLACMPKCARGQWRCIECKDVKSKNEFSDWLAPRARKVNDGMARCNICKARQHASLKETLSQSVSHVGGRSDKKMRD